MGTSSLALVLNIVTFLVYLSNFLMFSRRSSNTIMSYFVIFIRPSLPMLDFFDFSIYYKIPYMQHLHAIPYNNKCRQNRCKQRRWRAKKKERNKWAILIILVMFSCRKENKAFTDKLHEYFLFLGYREFILHDKDLFISPIIAY